MTSRLYGGHGRRLGARPTDHRHVRVVRTLWLRRPLHPTVEGRKRQRADRGDDGSRSSPRCPLSDEPPLPSCLWPLRIFPSLPGSRLTNFYRDASSALLQLV
ncbi:unnamed protein product, partial [Ascophyllum nodosum]